MVFKEIQNVYWKYYISLEDQLLETRRYVEFDYINNGRTYSIEYLKLFQAVCSEIDVVGKVLASKINESFNPSKRTGINEWWYTVTEKTPSLIDRACVFFEEKTLYPWENFKVERNTKNKAKKYVLAENVSPKAKTPSWWLDYNSVKHNRTGQFEKHSTNYAKANLKNLFFAFAALYSLEVELMTACMKRREKIPIDLNSRLFNERLDFYKDFLEV